MLDNFEQLLAAGPMLAELLGERARRDLRWSRVASRSTSPRSESTSCLRSSSPTRLGPETWVASGEIEAVRLFVERAQDARPDFELSDANADAIAELCVRMDGLPLALELAAARIKLLSPSAILLRLGGRLDLLKAAPGAGMPERHRTLRARYGMEL